VRQLATNEGKAADRVSPLQPGKAEKGTAWNTTLAGSGGATGTEMGARAVSQDTTSAQSAATQECIAMAWILLEALVALLLAVFIVWFTMGGRRKLPPRTPSDSRPPDDDGSAKGVRKK
jgi:hypothetical protein